MKKLLLLLFLFLITNQTFSTEIWLNCNVKLTDESCVPISNCKTTKQISTIAYVEVNSIKDKLFISFEERGKFWAFLSHWNPNDKARTIEYMNDSDLWHIKQAWTHANGSNVEESISIRRVTGRIEVIKDVVFGNEGKSIANYMGSCKKASGKPKF